MPWAFAWFFSFFIILWSLDVAGFDVDAVSRIVKISYGQDITVVFSSRILIICNPADGPSSLCVMVDMDAGKSC